MCQPVSPYIIRFRPRFSHPGNWGLRISALRPSDAGAYLCQISTFPTRVNVVNLRVTGKRLWQLWWAGSELATSTNTIVVYLIMASEAAGSLRGHL